MKTESFFAFDPEDTDEIRLEKSAIFLVAGACCLAGLVWTALYYAVFGWSLTTLLPFCFVLIVGSSLLISHGSKNHLTVIYVQIICIMYITALIQWSIGGVFESGLIIVWGFLGPLIALMFFTLRQSIIWFLLYLLNIAITVIFNEYFSSQGQTVAESTRLFFLFMNLSFASVVVFVFAGFFVTSARKDRERTNRLLLNVLPEKIAPLLKNGAKTIADHYDSASVLFADIVGSTPLFSEMEPAEAVDWLNEVFTMFDGIVEKYGLEKIRTIGDNYMVASGVPAARADHAQAIANLALDMIEQLKEVPARNGRRIEFRVGINSGTLVAGVIGQSKFHYDLWGDTVNIASRMESHGEMGMIHITQATYELLGQGFEYVSRGRMAIKGKGEMETWFLVRQRQPHI
jgi:guanylate cyclase